MTFASCNGIGMILGYALIFLAFLLSIFYISVHNQLDKKAQGGQGLEFAIALITLIVTILYFLYMIKDPFITLINKKK